MITAYHSKGALSVSDLYNMPVYLRNFYTKELTEILSSEAEAIKGKKGNNTVRK